MAEVDVLVKAKPFFAKVLTAATSENTHTTDNGDNGEKRGFTVVPAATIFYTAGRLHLWVA